MKQRVISGFIMAAAAIAIVLYGGWPFYALLVFVALYGSYEIIMIRNKESNKSLYLAMIAYIAATVFLPSRQTGILIFYIIVLFYLAMAVEDISLSDISCTLMLTLIIAYAISGAVKLINYNRYVILYLGTTGAVCDMAAFFIGSRFGKHKLIERVSPKKTWEGAIGGWFFGALVSLLFAHFFPYFGYPPIVVIVTSLLLPIVSELGDLSFSFVKRNYGVKDFSNLIPGHGGLLDRIDSILLCVLFFSSVVSFL